MPDDRIRETWGERIVELERWREREVDPELRELREAVTTITTQEKIAAGVADELRRRGITAEGVSERTATKTAAKIEEHGGLPRVPFTWYQKLGAFVAGAILLADSIRNLLS